MEPSSTPQLLVAEALRRGEIVPPQIVARVDPEWLKEQLRPREELRPREAPAGLPELVADGCRPGPPQSIQWWNLMFALGGSVMVQEQAEPDPTQ